VTSLYTWFIIVIGVLLQTTIVPFVQVGNARPDLLLMITVSVGLIFGRVAGASVGFFGGLVWDLLTAQIFGMHTLAKLITGYVAGSFEHKVFKDNSILPIVSIFLATFLHEVILYISAFMLEIRAPFLAMIGQTIAPSAVYNCLVVPFVYFGMYRIRELLWTEDRQSTEI